MHGKIQHRIEIKLKPWLKETAITDLLEELEITKCNSSNENLKSKNYV